MKKSILIAAIGIGSIVASFGQGKINFQNYYAYGQATGVKYAAGPISGQFAGSEITAVLYWGASSSTLFSQLTPFVGSATAVGGFGPVGPSVDTTGGAGVISGPTLDAGVGTFAWAIYASGTYQSVAYAGNTGVFVGPTSTSSLLPPANLPTGLLQANVLLTPVPEPTTLALAGLGGLASLVMLRRKQS